MRTMYGAVVFDDCDMPTSGWASLRGLKATRVRGVADLPTDVTWWTNLPPATFTYRPNLSAMRMMRYNYLRPQMALLHADLGLRRPGVSIQRAVEITAEVFDRVMRLAAEHYGLQGPEEDTLSADIHKQVARVEGSITPAVDEALRQAHQSFVTCDTDHVPGSKQVNFRRPMVRHAMEVLATPIPGYEWEYVPGDKLPDESRRVDWLIAQSRPVLAKIVVKRVDAQAAPIVAFSARRSSPRQWVSHPELLTLSRFAKLSVEAVHLGDGYLPHAVERPLFTGGEFGSLSVSAGILALNYCEALSSGVSYKLFTNNQKLFSPRAVWLAASDRFLTFMPALMLHGSGLTVQSYGRGIVTLSVAPGGMAEARACAQAAGLVPPAEAFDQAASKASDNRAGTDGDTKAR